MQPVETCEICGLDVPVGEGVRAEVSVGDMTCPVAMTFHPACRAAAAAVWQPSEGAACAVDPDLPELGLWTVPGAASGG
ncbi:MAG: hypothetical protein ABR575_05115 [Actinomycetota bacterium]